MRAVKILSWSRDGKGKVVDRPMRNICNTITTFSGRSIPSGHQWPEMENTTPYVLDVREREVRGAWAL